MRPKAAWMAGCVGGYIDTIRVAALQALANSARRAATSGESGSVSISPLIFMTSFTGRARVHRVRGDVGGRTAGDNPYDILPTAHASGGHHSRQARRRSSVARGDRVLRSWRYRRVMGGLSGLGAAHGHRPEGHERARDRLAH